MPVCTGTESSWSLKLGLRAASLLSIPLSVPTHPVDEGRTGDGLLYGACISQPSFESRREESVKRRKCPDLRRRTSKSDKGRVTKLWPI